MAVLVYIIAVVAVNDLGLENGIGAVMIGFDSFTFSICSLI